MWKQLPFKLKLYKGGENGKQNKRLQKTTHAVNHRDKKNSKSDIPHSNAMALIAPGAFLWTPSSCKQPNEWVNIHRR